MKDFFKRNKKTIDIYIIICLITIIICILFIIFPEVTKSKINHIKTTGIETKNNMDSYFTEKIIEKHKESIKENKEATNDSNDTIVNENNSITDKESEEINKIDEMKEKTVIEKYVFDINDYKDYYLNDTVILNYVNGNYNIDENKVILDENKINNLAFKVNSYNFDVKTYKLSFLVSLKELNNDINLSTENFYLYVENQEIKAISSEIDISENKDINIEFVIDKALSLEDLNINFMNLVYKDDFNYRNILLKGDKN